MIAVIHMFYILSRERPWMKVNREVIIKHNHITRDRSFLIWDYSLFRHWSPLLAIEILCRHLSKDIWTYPERDWARKAGAVDWAAVNCLEAFNAKRVIWAMFLIYDGKHGSVLDNKTRWNGKIMFNQSRWLVVRDGTESTYVGWNYEFVSLAFGLTDSAKSGKCKAKGQIRWKLANSELSTFSRLSDSLWFFSFFTQLLSKLNYFLVFCVNFVKAFSDRASACWVNSA